MKPEDKKISPLASQAKALRTSANRQKKEQLVAQLSDKVGKSKAFVFANFQGMTHQQLEGLKKGLKKADAELVAAKNTLLTIALKNHQLEAQPDSLQGPTAALFAYGDVVLPLKELAKTIKALKLPVIKSGILDGKAISAQQVDMLATLPSKDILIAQFVGGIKSPLYGLHRALSWNLQTFVMTLKAIEKTKPASSNQPSATS